MSSHEMTILPKNVIWWLDNRGMGSKGCHKMTVSTLIVISWLAQGNPGQSDPSQGDPSKAIPAKMPQTYRPHMACSSISFAAATISAYAAKQIVVQADQRPFILRHFGGFSDYSRRIL